MVVGLDFYTTSPPSLHSFRSVIRIGNALNGGTFHPKLYMFENAGGFCCIMKSSNFTSGGFGDNAELNVCVEGGKSDPFFRQVSAFIELFVGMTTEQCSEYDNRHARILEILRGDGQVSGLKIP